MNRRFGSVCALVLATLAACPACASQAAPADVCRIEGKVLDVKERTAPVFNALGGPPGTQTYTDVRVEVMFRETAVSETTPGVGNCVNIKAPVVAVYQLQHGEQPPKPGQMIRALTHVEGDEFRIGDWLFQIDNMP